jgi:mono/diheme cytochrome c family protein
MTHRICALVLVVAAGCKEPPAPRTCPSAGPVHAAPSASAAASVSADPIDERAQLQFFADKKLVRALTKHELRASLPIETIRIADHEYAHKTKTWQAIAIRPLLEKGFAGTSLDLAAQQFVLRCIDGYTVPIDGKRLLEDGGYIAIADADVRGWENVGPRQANPGPYFMVWKKPEQQSPDVHPRPYQLAAVDIASFESTFPHLIPRGEKDGSPTLRGFAIFREQCVRCHSINQQGGKIGPDLNVPKSIVEYRPEPQIKAYIKDPRAFRYGTMPAHPTLEDADLDGLLAYFRVMSKQKHDPQLPAHAHPAKPASSGP